MAEPQSDSAIGAWARKHRGKPPRSAAPKQGDDNDKAGKNGKGGKKRRSKKPLIILAIVLILIALVAFVWWFLTRNEVSTDDAYTDGNAVSIAPKVSGYVVRLDINDNVYVHKGQLMVQIDHRDYQAAVDRARAQLGLARAQLDAAQAQLDVARVQFPAQYAEARAQIESAQAAFDRAQADYARQHAVNALATTQQNIDAANAQARTARANVLSAQAQLRTAHLAPEHIREALATVEERREQIAEAEAQLESAQLNLAWCDLRAPSDGWITRRNVQQGSFVQAGTSLFSIVTPQVWVTANFKESQLTRMHVGDKVKISVDAWPKLDLRGHVDSIQRGSGSRFSSFPAENATGNFVKIVQRVPVKIVIDSGLPQGQTMPLGLSVGPTVYLTH